jgi:hypothetical protein
MDFAPEHMPRHGAADQGRGNVVEKARKNGDDNQQHEGAFPVGRQDGRHPVGHAAHLEMAREQRKAHQQQKQVRKDHPFMLHVEREAKEPGAEFEAGERELVERDRGKAGQRDLQRVMMKQRDPEQGQRK